jgi:hypothetical protein
MCDQIINEIIEFITEKSPNVKGRLLELTEINKILNDLYIKREQYFMKNYVHHRDWPDDDEYNMIYEYIDYIQPKLNQTIQSNHRL